MNLRHVLFHPLRDSQIKVTLGLHFSSWRKSKGLMWQVKPLLGTPSLPHQSTWLKSQLLHSSSLASWEAAGDNSSTWIPVTHMGYQVRFWPAFQLTFSKVYWYILLIWFRNTDSLKSCRWKYKMRRFHGEDFGNSQQTYFVLTLHLPISFLGIYTTCITPTIQSYSLQDYLQLQNIEKGKARWTWELIKWEILIQTWDF